MSNINLFIVILLKVTYKEFFKLLEMGIPITPFIRMVTLNFKLNFDQASQSIF